MASPPADRTSDDEGPDEGDDASGNGKRTRSRRRSGRERRLDVSFLVRLHQRFVDVRDDP